MKHGDAQILKEEMLNHLHSLYASIGDLNSVTSLVDLQNYLYKKSKKKDRFNEIFEPCLKDLISQGIVQVYMPKESKKNIDWHGKIAIDNNTLIGLTRKGVEIYEAKIKGDMEKWHQKPIGQVGIGVAVTVLGAFALLVINFESWKRPDTPPAPSVQVTNETAHPLSSSIKETVSSKAVLLISGARASIEIRKEEGGIRYPGGEISSADSSSIVYLPLGQPLKLSINAAGAKVAIHSELMPYIEVDNASAGSAIIEY
jgi:hypothetical protein